MPEDQDASFNIETDFEPQFNDFNYGQRVSFSTPGTPFVGSRYTGPSEIAYPSARSPLTTPPPREIDQWRDMGRGRVDAGFARGRTFEDTTSPWYQATSEEEAIAEANASPLAPASGRGLNRRMGSGMAMGVGFGAMALASGFERMYETDNSGRFVSPEQQSAQVAGLLPGVGTIAGTIIGGAAFGAPGAMLGSFSGGAIGSGIQGIVGANEDRAQATRETAERLSASLGAAAETVERFRTQIEATGAPVAQLSQGLQSLQGFGVGLSSGAIAGAGRMALAEGVDFQRNTQAIGGFLSSSPGNYALQQQFAENGGELSSGQFRGIARSALFEGDFAAYNAAQAGVAAARVRSDPAALAAEREIARNSGGFLGWASDVEDHLGLSNNRSRARVTLNNRQAALTTADGSDGDRQYSLNVGAARLALTRSEADLGGLQAGYGLTAINGGSASDLAALLPGIGGSVNSAVGADQSLIGLLNPNDPSDALKIARLQADQQQRRLGFSQLQHANTLLGFSENASAFQLGNLRDTLGGLSNAQQAPGDLAFANALITQARVTPGLSPTERDQLETQGLQSRYATQMGVFNERLNANSAGIAAAGVGVARATAFGGSADVAGAESGVLREYQDRIRELNAEIRSGVMTVADRTNAERELSQTRAGAITLQASIGRDESLGVLSLAATSRDTAGVGLDRLLAVGGSAGLPGAELLRRDSASLAAAQGIVANNPQQRAERDLAVRQAQLGLAQDNTLLQTYSPDIGTREAGLHAQTAYQMSQVLPFTDGADPLASARGLIAFDRQQQGRYSRAAASATDPLARFANEQQASALGLDIAGLERSQQTAWLSMLPETMAGMPLAPGVGSAVLPRPAMAALYGPSSVNGSFGPPSRGGMHSGSGQSHEDSQMGRLIQVLETLARNGAKFSSTPPGNTVGAAVQIGSQSRNPYTGK